MRDRHALSTRALIFTLGYITVAVGYGQFGSTSALGNVAKAFGIATDQSSFTAHAGLALTTLAIGIAMLRAASLLALPLSPSPTGSVGTASCSCAASPGSA